MDEYAEFFNKNGYVVMREVLDSSSLEMLRSHLEGKETEPGYFSAKQHDKAIGVHGDVITEQLLLYLLPLFEKAAAVKLLPTYAFYRKYFQHSILPKHTDRDACEYTVTLTLGYQAPFIWPIYVEINDMQTGVELNCGDLLLYKGITTPHWRDAFEGSFWQQIFLHYVEADGKYASHKFDGRRSLAV